MPFNGRCLGWMIDKEPDWGLYSRQSCKVAGDDALGVLSEEVQVGSKVTDIGSLQFMQQ